VTTSARQNAPVKPTEWRSDSQAADRARSIILGVAALVGVVIPVLVAVLFSPLWWISVVTTVVLAFSGFMLTRVPEQRPTARLLLGAAATANLIDLVFWAGPDNYFGELGFVAQWLPVPLLAQVFLVYPGGVPVAGARRFFAAAWVWATVPRLASALASLGKVGPATDFVVWEPVTATLPGLALLWVEAALSIGLATWATILFRQRWLRARGTATALIRIMAAAGIVVSWGLVAREVGWGLFTAGLLSRWSWDRIGDVHQLVIVASVATVGFTVVRSFARRGRLTERLVGTAGDPRGLEAALREELRDPTVELFFRTDDGWRTSAGVPVEPPTRTDRDVVELGVPGGRATVLASLDPDDRLDPVRRRVALAASGMVLSAASVAIERDAYVEEVAASRTRIAAEAEAQRRNLERMLHDGVQQSLLATTATLSRAKLAARSGDAAQLDASLEETRKQLLDALAELRSLARGIYPAALAESGLVGGVQSLTDRWQTVSLLVAAPEDRYSDVAEANASLLYFAIAEGLANAHKYGTPPVAVVLRQDATTVTGEVTDAGGGGAAFTAGGGLEGLRDRVNGLSGRLELSSPPGGPTRLTVTLPRR
jgi:signal transduction histidine kinase